MGALLYQTLRESIVDAIRSKIFNHEIKSGQRIVELELAKEFHTSRGPIREALRQLENEGIIVPGCIVDHMLANIKDRHRDIERICHQINGYIRFEDPEENVI